jgi:hypothetical protein
LGNQVDWFSLHRYQPWVMKEIRRDGQLVPPSQLDLESFWYAAVSVPDIDAKTGLSMFAPPSLGKIRAAGKPLAVTEWNWNGWWGIGPTEVRLPDSLLANGVGAAGYLHALLRAGDVVKLATQSMLVGGRWGLAAVGVKADDPHYLVCRPTGQVTALYSRDHGAEVVRLESDNQSHFSQPFTLGGIRAIAKVAFVDAVATRTGDRLYLHCINRDFRDVRPVVVRLTGRRLAGKELELHRLTGRLHSYPADGEAVNPAVLEDIQIPATLNESGGFVLRLPPRSVSVYIVPLTPVK